MQFTKPDEQLKRQTITRRSFGSTKLHGMKHQNHKDLSVVDIAAATINYVLPV